MSRLMSVAFTEDAVRERRKTVTRRKGWWATRNGDRLILPGNHLTLCRKVMGRKPGEPLVRLAEVVVVSVRREPLDRLLEPVGMARWWADAEMEREGFPGMEPAEFVARYFTEAQKIPATAEVTRIEWRYLDGEAS